MENTYQQNTPQTQKQTNIAQQDWIKQELANIDTNQFEKELPAALKLEENKLTSIEIDLSEGPFRQWQDPETKTIKKMIPCIVNGEKRTWWLNVRNPAYSQIIKKLNEGQVGFTIMRIGQQNKTRYTIIEK